jgi:hypothetical protein
LVAVSIPPPGARCQEVDEHTSRLY